MSENHIDPIILDSVRHVRDRFGVGGLRELIDEAQRELGEAEAALDGLTPEADEPDLP
ncbi:MAG: hypothetical protein ACRDQA_14005 [Nocardioidaceae bacterium]